MKGIAASGMSFAAVYIAFLHLCTMVAAIPECVICASPNPSPGPEADSPALAPTPSAESPGIDPAGVFDVTLYGATADGKNDNSLAFLSAWEMACAYPENATLHIPEGTYFVGPISFNGPCFNNKSPKVEIRGTLKAPSSLNAFPSSNWIVFRDLYGFSLTDGTRTSKLDAQGAEAWSHAGSRKGEKDHNLPVSLKFINISHGTISNISLLNSKGFHIGFLNSDNIDIYDVNITAPEDSPNTDGIHISYSTNISITSSTIGVGDDCVSIGPGSTHISVSNVKCGPGHGISVGSLGKYQNEKDVVDVSVRNSTINGTQNGIRIKTWQGVLASNASNMRFEDIVMINVSNPIIIDQEYCPSGNCPNLEPSQVKLAGINFKNITGTYNSKLAVTLLCSSAVACENIELLDINLNSTVPESPRTGRLNVKGKVQNFTVLSSSF